MCLTLLMLFVLALFDAVSAAPHGKRDVDLNSEALGLAGLTMPESTKPIQRISFRAKVDEKGEGSGVLVLDPTAGPTYDEFGFPTPSASVPPIKLACELKFVKKTTVKVPLREVPVSPEPAEQRALPGQKAVEVSVEWRLYSLSGPRITSRIFLATAAANEWREARLLLQDEQGKVKYAVDLRSPPEPRIEPCHPGCFPAGTLIRLPEGTIPIERIRAGDLVTTVRSDGTASRGRVEAVFKTHNRLVEVRTNAGTLVTTETQPLALVDGGLRGAGELKAGDRISGAGKPASGARPKSCPCWQLIEPSRCSI